MALSLFWVFFRRAIVEGGNSAVKSNMEDLFTMWFKGEWRRKCNRDGGVVIKLSSLSLLRYNEPSEPSEQ